MQDSPSPRQSRAHRLSQRLIVVEEPRILYLSIPKCGCTFVKNVLWHLQFGRFHSTPVRVHDDDNRFARASEYYEDAKHIVGEESAFTVVRNPIDRFLSLYFDKIVGSGRDKYVPLAQTLVERHSLVDKPSSLADHRYNLEILSSWLQKNLNEGIDMPSEAHWTPQAMRADVMREFDLKLLHVDNLKTGLVELLKHRVPQIELIAATAERNQSRKDFSKRELLTSQIKRRINEVYSDDRKLYRKTVLASERLQRSPASTVRLPRFHEVFD